MTDEPIPRSARDVVHLLGGAAALAAAMRLNKSAVQKWCVDGIPGRHWPEVARQAKARADAAACIDIDLLERIHAR